MKIRAALLFPVVLIGIMTGSRLNAEAVKTTKTDVIASIKMVDLPGGAFQMGATTADGQQGYPAHAVTVTRFKLAETDVTFDQYDGYAEATSHLLPQDDGFGRGDQPVINVSWRDMHNYITWLNSGTGRHFRLPTEAEWEYAARAGTTTNYYWGDTVIPNVANSVGGGYKDKGPSPVRSFPPNPFGLYDMAGNVWQAVEDCLHPTFDGAPANGKAWVDPPCMGRIARGGYFGSITRGIRVTSRSGIGETFQSMGLGFRLAEDASPAKP